VKGFGAVIKGVFSKTNLSAVIAVAWLFVLAPAEAATAKPQLVAAAAAAEDEVNDPLEPVNRAIFRFNEVVQDAVLGPVAHAYNDHVPATVRLGVSNFLTNLSSPIYFVNNVLQGDITGALQVFVRFLVNSTVGIGGIADVVSEVDGKPRKEDFGQTLGVWGMGEGFYLVLPIFGPSNPRDAVGKFLVDPYFNPFGMWVSNTDRTNVEYSEMALSGVDEYAGVIDELEQIQKTSVDYYAAIRSLYRQKRKAEISNGDNIDLPPIPNLSYDLVPSDFSPSVAGAPGGRGAAK
jgi:phospholipid-binding lipoprotein MlaA